MTSAQQPTRITVPQAERVYFVRKDHDQLLKYVDSIREKGENTNVLVTGPQGSGKSTLPLQYAATRGLPLAVVEVGLLSEAAQIIGRIELRGGQTVYIPSEFAVAVQTPGCVVHLQEINRPESDRSLNAIFSLLDPTQRRMWVDDADKVINVAPGVTFFASLNEGYEFVGTMPLDVALADRFALRMELGYLPVNVEINLLTLRSLLDEMKATHIVQAVDSIRNNVQASVGISTRSVLEIANMVSFGVPLSAAIIAAVPLDKDQLETILLSLQMGGTDLGALTDEYGFMSAPGINAIQFIHKAGG